MRVLGKSLEASRSKKSCTSKYVGEYCQHLNPCHTGPRCQNGGSCRVREIIGGGTPSFTCSCPVGFTASLCEIPIDNACDSSPCLNGATCNLKSLREYMCTCATGYTGDHCEREDFCASSPCRNGAECRSLEDNYKCTCSSGFAGRNCADDIDECERNPCKHGACKNIHGSYKCRRNMRSTSSCVSRTPITSENGYHAGLFGASTGATRERHVRLIARKDLGEEGSASDDVSSKRSRALSRFSSCVSHRHDTSLLTFVTGGGGGGGDVVVMVGEETREPQPLSFS
ncbi:hypothetical protein M0804_000277 [Polistes exclamans]|nr:hypothetical protein M0804_000277 [Polistes exclamans]